MIWIGPTYPLSLHVLVRDYRRRISLGHEAQLVLHLPNLTSWNIHQKQQKAASPHQSAIHTYYSTTKTMAGAKKKFDESILKRLGGVTVLVAMIDEFYFRLLADDSLTIFFQNVDLSWLKNHQKNFLMSALSGPVNVESSIKHIRRAHSRLFDKGLNEKHFDTVAAHLVATLKDMRVDPKLVNEVSAVIGPLRPAFYAAGKKNQDHSLEQPAVKKQRNMWGFLGVLFGRR